MHATSTPTLAQPKPSAFGAIAAVALAFGIAAGAIAAVNLAPTTGTATSGAAIGQTGAGLSLHRNGETGALTPAQRGLKLQRQGEIAAGVTTTPVEVMPKVESVAAPAITSPSAQDQMAYWNTFSLIGPSAHDALRAAGGWYAFQPLGRSAFEALGGDVRWYVFPSTAADDQPVGVSHR